LPLEEQNLDSRRKKMKTLKILQVIILSGLILGGGFVSGCGGPETEIRQQQITTTLGQELTDLDAAYKKGLITEKEYQKAKKDILRRYEK
jgi:hypothetical protein